jgi:hypothetical protein
MRRFLFIIILLNVKWLNAQVSIEADTTHIRIGEQVSLQVISDSINDVIFPEFQVDSLKKVEIVTEFSPDTLKNRLYKKYLLTSFDSGTYVIPGQKVLIGNRQYLTDSLLLQVNTVAVDTTKQGLFPIKPILKAPPKDWNSYHWIWYLLLLLLLGLGAYFWYQKRKGKIKEKIKSITAYELAINQLKLLDEKNYIARQHIKEYYTELTAIIRNYIENDVQIAAMEITSEELIDQLKIINKKEKLGIPAEKIKHLQGFLQGADLVKFAKARPMEINIYEDRKFTESLLQELKESIEKEVDEEGNVVDLVNTPIEVERQSKSSKKVYIGLAIVFVLLMGLGTLWHYGFKHVKDTFLGHPSKELLEGKWYRTDYGYPAVSIEAPVVLEANNATSVKEALPFVKSIAIFDYGSLVSGFNLVVSTTVYNPQIEIDINQVVQGAINQIESTEGVENLNHQVDDIEKYGKKGKVITGAFESMGQKMVFTGYQFAEKNNLQQIFIARFSDDTYAAEIEKRVIQSIRLANP